MYERFYRFFVSKGFMTLSERFQIKAFLKRSGKKPGTMND
jgi:hypothetical protein